MPDLQPASSGEKTPTPDHGSINGYTHGGKTPTPKWFPPQSRSPSHLTSSIYFSYIQHSGQWWEVFRHGCHGHTDKGRVERGIERQLYFTEPPVPYISPISSPCRLNP